MRPRLSPLFAVAAGALLPVSSPATAAPHSYTVVIDKMKFGPVPAGLRKGDTIVWDNRDMLRHTATAVDRTFDVDLPAGKAAKTVISRSGTIPFSCRFHPGMKGVLQVK
jgi:plastocyanin